MWYNDGSVASVWIFNMVISFNSRLCIANNNEESEMFKLPIWQLRADWAIHTLYYPDTLQLQGLQVFYQAWFLVGQDRISCGDDKIFLTESFIDPAALERLDNEWNILICCTIVLIAKYTEYHLPSHIPYLEHTAHTMSQARTAYQHIISWQLGRGLVAAQEDKDNFIW